MTAATRELVSIRQLLEDFQVTFTTPALLFYDNQVVMHIASNPIFYEHRKHIEIDCYFVRDKVTKGLIRLMPIRSLRQLADIFTKALPSSLLFSLLS